MIYISIILCLVVVVAFDAWMFGSLRRARKLNSLVVESVKTIVAEQLLVGNKIVKLEVRVKVLEEEKK